MIDKLPPETGSAIVDVIHTQANMIRDLEKRNEQLETVIAFAKDAMAFWPQFSFRTIRTMATKMESLKQALDTIK